MNTSLQTGAAEAEAAGEHTETVAELHHDLPADPKKSLTTQTFQHVRNMYDTTQETLGASF